MTNSNRVQKDEIQLFTEELIIEEKERKSRLEKESLGLKARINNITISINSLKEDISKLE